MSQLSGFYCIPRATKARVRSHIETQSACDMGTWAVREYTCNASRALQCSAQALVRTGSSNSLTGSRILLLVRPRGSADTSLSRA